MGSCAHLEGDTIWRLKDAVDFCQKLPHVFTHDAQKCSIYTYVGIPHPISKLGQVVQVVRLVSDVYLHVPFCVQFDCTYDTISLPIATNTEINPVTRSRSLN